MSAAGATGAQIGIERCSACGFERARVKEGRNGTLAIHCTECGSTTMVKSPKAVGSLRARLGKPADDKKPEQKAFGAGVIDWLTKP